MHSTSRERTFRFLVILQVFLLVMALFAPIPAAAADPSADPSAPPSAEPSADPSADPSASPSAEPTAAPTDTPAPTAEPTPEPTAEPTAAPTPEPTAEPTAEPTPEPTPDETPAPPVQSNGYIVEFAPGTPAATQTSTLAAVGAVVSDSIPALGMAFIDVPNGSSVVTDLLADGNVSRVEADRVRTAEADPSDSGYADQWSLAKIGWNNVFGTVTPSGSAVVALLDTGVDGSHPDLAGQLVAGTSILDGSAGTFDPNGHGTAMAGIIAALTDNGQGIAGIGYAGVKVMPVTVLDANGEGTDSDIIQGVIWAVDHGADVINMSFSNPGFSDALQAAIDYAWAHNVVVVAATGNDGSSTVTFPAGDRGVIGVSNTDQTDGLNASSNYGADTFLGAPGTDIATLAAGGGVTSVTGTSASSAEVAAAAALLRASDPAASNGVIVGRLGRSAEAAGTVDQTGNGRLDLERALADSGTELVQPAGAAPVGRGGPIVGPYLAAARSGTLTVTPSLVGASTTNVFALTYTNTAGSAAINADNTQCLTITSSSFSAFTGASLTNSSGRNWSITSATATTITLKAAASTDQLRTAESLSLNLTATAPAAPATSTFTATATFNTPTCALNPTVATASVIVQKAWNGSVSTAWNLANNWSPSGIPASSDQVLIPSGTPFSPIISTTPNAVAQSLTVDAGATLTISGASVSTPGNGGTITVNGTLVLSGGSVVDPSSNQNFNLGSTGLLQMTSTTPLSAFPPVETINLNATSTVQYSAPGNQTVASKTYGNLSLSGGGTKTVAGDIAVAGDMSNALGTTVNVGSNDDIFAGDVTNSGTWTGVSNATINGTSAQAISGNAITFANTTFANTAGVSISGFDLSVTGNLVLGATVVSTGANKVIKTSTTAPTRTTGFVNGALQRTLANATGSVPFAVGNTSGGTNSTQLDLNGTFGSTAVILVRSTFGDHPQNATNGGSGIDPGRSVNTYWSVSLVSGTWTSSGNSTFNYTAGNVDGTAAASTFNVRRWNGSAWSSVGTSGTPTTTVTSVTGLSSTAVGDFVIGNTDAVNPTVVSSNRQSATNPTNATTVTYRVTFSEAVTGVDATDFALTNTGTIAGASVATVTPVTTNTYDVVVNTGSGDGTIRLDVTDNDSIVDGAGNRLGGIGAGNGSFITGQTFTIDKSAPTVTAFTCTPATTPTIATTFNCSVTFSEAPGTNGFDSTTGDVTIGGTSSLWTKGASSGSGVGPYTFTVSRGAPNSDGSLTIQISGGAVNDGAGNSSVASSTISYTIDTVAPTVSAFSCLPSSSPSNSTSFNCSVTFSESVTGFSSTTTDVTIGGTSSVWTKGASSGTGAGPYTFTVSRGAPNSDGTLTIQVAAGAVQDQAGSNSAASSPISYTIDTGTPTVNTFTCTPSTTPSNSTSFNCSVTFSESVTGFDSTTSDVTVGGTSSAWTKGASSGSAAGPYTFSVTRGAPNSDGTLTIQIAASAAQDAAGNNSAASSTITYTIDTTAPTVTSINREVFYFSPDTNASSVTFRVTFSEFVTGVDASDFSVFTTGTFSVATVGTVSSVNLGTFDVTVSTTGNGTVRLDVVDDDTIADPAGNKLGGTGTGNGNHTGDQTFTIDQTGPNAPTILTSPADPTNSTSATFTFSATDQTVGGVNTGVAAYECSLNGFSFQPCSSGVSYSGLSEGNRTFAVRAIDTVGNTGSATTYGWAIDLHAPTTTITSTPANPSNSTSAAFTFTTNDPLALGVSSGVASVQCQLDYAGYVACDTATSQAYLVGPGGHTFDVRSIDNAGNTGLPDEFSWAVDTTNPTATLTSTPTDPTNSTSASFTFLANDPDVDFYSSGVASVECQLDGAGYVGCDTIGNQDYTGLAEGNHTFDVRAIDNAGNIGDPDSYSWTVDTTNPTVTIDQASGQADPTITSPIHFTAVFSEAVTGFTDSDVSFLGSTAGGSLLATVAEIAPNDGTTYDVSIAGMTSRGTIVATIPAGGASDAATNGNTASTSSDNSVTWDRVPSATVALDNASPLTNDTLTATATRSDPDGDAVSLRYVWKVNGTTKQDVTKSTNTAADLSDTFDLSVAGNGSKGDTITVEVTPNDGLFDGSTASDTATVANSAPTVTLSAGNDLSVDEGSTHTYDVVAADADGDSLSFVGGYPTCGTGGSLVGSPTVAGGSFDCSFPDGPASPAVAVKVTDGVAASSEATQTVTVNNVAPTVTLSPTNDLSVDEGSVHTYSYTISEPGDDTITGVAIDCGANGTSSNETNDDTSGSFDCTFPDGPASSTVSAQATDSDGAAGNTDSQTVTVENVRPSISLNGPNTADEGSTQTYTFTVTDPGDDTHTVIVSCGLNGAQTGTTTYDDTTGLGSFDCFFADGPATTFVTATVTDSDGASDVDAQSVTVTVDNVAPTVSLSAGNALSVNEGSTHTYSFTTSDPGTDTFVLDATDCGLNGTQVGSDTFDSATGAGSFDCTFPDGPASSIVSVTLSDSDGLSDDDSQTVTVENVAPTIAISGAASVNEGSAYSLTLGAVTDPGDDTVTSYIVHWGDGDTDTYSTDGIKTHTYADGPSTQAITVDLVDEDGTFADAADALSVSVQNVAPTVTLSATNDLSVDEGSLHTYSYTISDPGTDTITGVAIDCGANGTSSNETNDDTSGSFDCTFPDGPASSTVSAQATDSDGDAGNTDSQTVTVDNVAPTIAISGAASVNEGSAYSLTLGAVTDPGDDTVTSYIVHWGDGDTDTYSTDGIKTHTYADGPSTQAITVDLVDEDGTFSDAANALSVSVLNVRPSISLNGPNTADEGSTQTYTFTVTDPGDDTHTVIVSCGLNGAQTGTTTYDDTTGLGSFDCFFADGPATTFVTATVTDSDGASDVDAQSVTVTVDNVAPTVSLSAGNALSVNEGSTHTYSFTTSDPGDDTFVLDATDCGLNGSQVGSATFDSTTGAGSFDCTFPDGPASSSVSVTVSDSDGLSDTDSQTVTVQNVAPTVTLSPTNDLSVDEGSSHTYSYTISDPGADTITSVAIDCGANGTSSNETNDDTSGSFDCTFPDGPASSTVSAQATDSDGDAGNTDSQTVTVQNVAPTVTLSPTNDLSVDEGSVHTYSYTISDPGDDTITGVAIDCGLNGTSSNAINDDTSGSFDCTFPDGPASSTVSAQATDSDGDAGNTDSQTVTVQNVAPTVTLSPTNDLSVDEGSSHTYSYTISDPGDDTITGVAIDCGLNGTSSNETNDDTSGSFDCTFPDGPASSTVSAQATDSDGAAGNTDSQTVTVENVRPSISLNGPNTADEGSTQTYTFTVTDPGDDTHTVIVSCGLNGAQTGTTTYDDTTGLGSFDCFFADGPATTFVTATVTDSDGAADVDAQSVTVTVDNVAPTVTLSLTNDLSVDEGSTHTYSFTTSDPGTDTFVLDATDCGLNGSQVGSATFDSTTGAGSFDCTFPDGPASSSVSVTVSDSDGLSDTDSQTVTVQNVAPTVTLSPTNDLSVDEGSSHTYSYTISDPGADTITSVAIDCGANGTSSNETNDDTSGSFDCTFPDGPASSTVSAQATDSDGDAGNTDTQTVTVKNVAPTVTLSLTNDLSVDEGSTHTYSYTISDPGTDTITGVAIDCGANGTSSNETNDDTSGSFDCTFPDGPASSTVSAQATDSDGDAGNTDSQTVTVENVAPTVTLSGAASVNEGSAYSLTLGAVTDPGDDTVTSYIVHWGDGDTDTYATNGIKTHTYADGPSTQAITVDLVDEDGTFADAADALSVSVLNVAPTIAISGAASVNEGSAYSLTLGAVTDPGDDTVTSYIVHWGDGDTDTYSTDGIKTHTYADGPSTQAITVDLVDEDGTFADAADALSVSVDNVAPTVLLGGPSSVNEGSAWTYTYTVTDPGVNDTFTVDATYPTCGTDGTLVGTPTVTAGGGSFDCSFPDGPASTHVAIKVTDNDGGSDLDSENVIIVAVANVAPTATLSNDGPVDEGSPATISFSAQLDPSPTDTTAGFHYEYTCDGSAFGPVDYASATTSASTTCTFADDGTYTVRARIIDKNNGFTSYTTSVTVDNVAPTIAISGAASVNEGSAYSLTLGAVTDPGDDTVTSYIVHWGDGDTDTYSTDGIKTHTYADGPSTQAITVDLVDEDGTFSDAADALSVSVDNVAPTIAISGAPSVNEGSAYSLTLGAVTDPGDDTVTSYIVHWGDGDTDTYSTDGIKTHTYADGPSTQAITVDLVDEDGTFADAADALSVSVDNVAPTVLLGGPSSVNEGSAWTYTYTVTDPGVNDTFTVDATYPTCGTDGTLVGTPTVTAGGGSFDCSFPDGPASTHVAIKVTDNDGGSDLDSENVIIVAVANVAPTATLSNDGPVDEGSPATISFSAQLDPSPTDTTAGFHYEYTCDGSAFGPVDYASATTSASTTCTFADDGTYTVRARIIDKNNGFTSYTTSVTVDNVAPTAVNDSYTTNEDTLLSDAAPGVLGNDTDPGADPLTAVLVVGPSHAASFTLNADGSFTYTPAANYNGPDSFTYKASDGSLTGNTATVSLTVNAVNDAPVANNDSYNTNEDTALTIPVPGVLGNDTDVDGDSLNTTLVVGPTHGMITFFSDGHFTYTPAANYNGPDSFTYKANDGTVDSNTATVSLTVTAVNDAPVANDDPYATNEDTTLTVAAPGVLGNDTDIDSPTLTAVVVVGPTHAASFTLNADGSFSYAPAANYNGPDSFTYKANDGFLDSNVATVSINVTSVNDAPSGTDKTVTTPEDTAYTFSAADFGFSDPDGNSLLAVKITTLPASGTLKLGAVAVTTGQVIPAASIGTLTFTPVANASGSPYTTFTFQVQDNGGTANGGVDLDPSANTITVNVTSVNDAPSGTDKTVTTPEDTAYTFSAADFGFSDPDGNTLLAVKITTLPASGTLKLGAVAVTTGQVIPAASIGSLTFTPVANASGSPYTSFTFQVQDNGGTANGGVDLDPSANTITVNVTAVNDAPVANNDSYTTDLNVGFNLPAPGVLANDTDVDGPSLTASLVVTAANGTLTFNANGSFTYTPNTDFVGVDTFTYKASDGLLLSNTATVSITVLPATTGLLADIATTDADFNHIDGFDVLFGNGSGSSKKLQATNPGTFHYELDLQNETGVTMHVKGKKLPPIYKNGVAIDDNNGGSTVVIITVPSLPTTVGTTVPSSPSSSTPGSPKWTQDAANSAFKADGYKAVRAHPDDRSDDMDLTVSWVGSLPSGYTCLTLPETNPAWHDGQPPNNAFIKCIKVEGLEIPKHHEAHIHISFEFGLKGTDNWLSTAQSAFRAGFSFKSQTQVTLDPTFPIPSLAGKTYIGNDAAGIVGAGQQYTAIGGFIYDTNGAGIGGALVRLFNSAPTPSTMCSASPSQPVVAWYSTDADGFYFIGNKMDNNVNNTGNNLPSGIKYYVAVCNVPNVTSGYWPARYMSDKLNTKEFDEEDFYVSNPTHLGFSIQPVTNQKLNRTMYTVQVALLDAYNNVVSDDNTKVTLSIASGSASGVLSGTLQRTMSNGYATFTDLKISGSGSAAGTYILNATDTTGSGSPHPFTFDASTTFNMIN